MAELSRAFLCPSGALSPPCFRRSYELFGVSATPAPSKRCDLTTLWVLCVLDHLFWVAPHQSCHWCPPPFRGCLGFVCSGLCVRVVSLSPSSSTYIAGVVFFTRSSADWSKPLFACMVIRSAQMLHFETCWCPPPFRGCLGFLCSGLCVRIAALPLSNSMPIPVVASSAGPSVEQSRSMFACIVIPAQMLSLTSRGGCLLLIDAISYALAYNWPACFVRFVPTLRRLGSGGDVIRAGHSHFRQAAWRTWIVNRKEVCKAHTKCRLSLSVQAERALQDAQACATVGNVKNGHHALLGWAEC